MQSSVVVQVEDTDVIGVLSLGQGVRQSDHHIASQFMDRLVSRVGAQLEYRGVSHPLLPVRITPRQAAAWMADPDAYDVESVDVRGKPLRNVGDRKGVEEGP